MKHSNVILKGILSGVYIALAAIVYIYVLSTTGNKLVASILFSIALLVIVNRGYYLYTGKVGYLLPYEKGNVKMILETILGNTIGILAIGLLMNLVGVKEINEYASSLVSIKFNNEWYKVLALSILCGILMYTAVDGFNNINNDFGKNIIVILSVVVFLVSCFEHSIANIAYLVLAKTFSFKMFLYLIIMLIGNGIGAIAINLIHSYIKKSSVWRLLFIM